VLALIAVYLACFRDYAPYLAPGEVATIAVLAANRPQARSIFRYISGILKAVPLFARMVVDENTESIALANRVLIEIGTASFRTTRIGLGQISAGAHFVVSCYRAFRCGFRASTLQGRRVTIPDACATWESSRRP
jgi:hypothetical protein